jgi:hypothetical protein
MMDYKSISMPVDTQAKVSAGPTQFKSLVEAL